jgi:hypothetical protein
MHRVTLETQYDKEGSLRSVKILDPQTALSGVYLSDASALCEAAFTELKKTESRVATEYIAAGIQLPMTGNCQKMAAYIAVVLGEGTSIEELTLKEANAFCTKLHNTDTATSKSTKWLGGWLPKLW